MEFKRMDVAIVALILSAGLVGAGFFAGHGFYMSRMADRYVTVKGLAERDVTADLAVWSLKVTTTGDDLTLVQDKIETDREALMAFLQGQKFVSNEIGEGKLTVTDLMAQQYRSERAEQSRYILNFSVVVRSTDIAKIQKASALIGTLIKKGLVLSDSGGPNYIFTRLNEIKPEMIAEATKSARKSAEQFAADSGSRVGSIRRASQGIFSIEARDGAPRDVDDGMYGDAQVKQVDKKVRVVSTIDYALEQ